MRIEGNVQDTLGIGRDRGREQVQGRKVNASRDQRPETNNLPACLRYLTPSRHKQSSKERSSSNLRKRLLAPEHKPDGIRK